MLSETQTTELHPSLSEEATGAAQASALLARHRVLFLLCAILLTAVAIWGSPFLLDYLNSGDQVPPMLQSVDPQLFPADPVVAAMGRLKSGFYLALAAVMRSAAIAPRQTESVLYSLYVLSKLLLIAAVFSLTWTLRKSFWFFAVFAAWCCHQKPALLGSITLFMPVITHNEVALIFGLFALVGLLRGRMMLFWLLAGIAVLVHVLVGLQFVLCVLPPLLWQRKLDTKFVLGAAIFALCCLVYLLTMAPPALSPAEWQLFVSTNGGTGHISLFNHNGLDWFGFASLFGLALAASARFLKGDAGFTFLRRAAIWGTLTGLLLSLAAVATQAMKLMLFQPMRIFYWVTLFCFLLLAAAAVEAFKTERLAGVLLAATFALSVLNSILAPVVAFIGLGYLLAERLLSNFKLTVNVVTRAILALGALGVLVAWALGARQPINSLRSPVLLPAVVGLATLCLARFKNWQPPLAAILIVYCLTAASVYRHNYAKRWTDADWRAVRLWCQANTRPSDRFITPPDQVGFRVLALRSTASESLPRIIWAAPSTYQENLQAAERAAKGYGNANSDPAYLFELAREWNCQYVIARGAYDGRFTPLFRAGEFSVLKTPEQAHQVARR